MYILYIYEIIKEKIKFKKKIQGWREGSVV